MNKLIRDISLEDRRKLTEAFQKQSAKSAAEQSGGSKDDLRQRMVNGKYQWVKKAQLLQEEERKKKILASSRPIRALRDGENSLLSLIHKTLTTYSKQVNEAKRMGYLNGIEGLDCSNSISKIQNRTESFANELGEVENKIELTKCQNPVIVEAEKLLLLLSQLKQNGDEAGVQQMQRQNAGLLVNYQNQRKSLSPLIEHARHLRSDLQREYWRAMQASWNLYELVFQKDVQTLDAKIESISASDLKKEIRDEVQEAKNQFDAILERENTLTAYLPSTLQPNSNETQNWDEILPVMSSLLAEIEFMTEVLKSITAKFEQEPEPDIKSTSPSSRMAFTSSKKQ